jgi:DNA-binding transcriptional regulator YhcF (GntR family)
MIDIQHDSPVPIYEQIAGQLRSQIASGVLGPGARLAEYRSFAQELLTNPQAVAKAYGDLEYEGVLKQCPGGRMEVTPGAAVVCRVRLQEVAKERLRQAVAQGIGAGLVEAEMTKTFEQALAAARAVPLSDLDLQRAIQKPTHERRHRDSSAIQDLSRQEGA